VYVLQIVIAADGVIVDITNGLAPTRFQALIANSPINVDSSS